MMDCDIEQKAENQTVSISVCGSRPLLWRAADITECREKVGVVGTLVGSLARQPRQNVRLGRPLEILQEEARLLLETGKATAVRHKEVTCEVHDEQCCIIVSN